MSEDSNQPHPRPTGRTRRPRGSLSPELILDAAEAVAEEAAGAITVRAVAGRLGAVPMALYNHFATKEQLVDALLDRVLSRFEPEAATTDWAEDLRRFARAHRRLLTSHPWAVSSLFARPNPGLGAVRIGEHALGILRRGGLGDAAAVAAFSGVVALNYGWSSFTTARDLDPGSPGHDVADVSAALPAELFPLTVAVAAELGAYGSGAHYDLVLGSLVSGLAATVDRHGRTD